MSAAPASRLRLPTVAASLLGVALLGSGCVTTQKEYTDRTDAGRTKQIAGHWYDQYMQGASYAQGDTVYRSNGTFVASYESVSQGGSVAQRTQRETVEWSGKWHIEGGQLIEDITHTSDASRAPADRPLKRYVGTLDRERMILRSEAGNVNAYARKRPTPPKVTFTPVGETAF